MSYQVIIPDRIHNTCLDERFPTREEAKEALAIVRQYWTIGDDEVVIVESSEPPTTTLAEWNERGW